MSTTLRRAPLAGDSIIAVAIALSVAVHALLLAVHFVPSRNFHVKPDEESLQVILINAKSKSKPVKADAIAQHDFNGGGEQNAGRATSYLPASPDNNDGDLLARTQALEAQLEAQQKALLAQTLKSQVSVDPDGHPVANIEASHAYDALATVEQMRAKEAEIAKELSDYNKRPTRGVIGPNTKGAVYAAYYTRWRERIERLGNAEYPPAARGKISGEGILSVTLTADGNIYHNQVVLVQPSGYPILDRAAESIVRHSAPFEPFPPEMKKQYEVYEIVSKFQWIKGTGLAIQVEKQ